MKKLFALLLAVAMVLSMAACGAEKPADTTAAPVADDTTAAPTTTAAVVTRENKVIYGSSTDVTGDFSGGLVTNGAADVMVYDLVNDYSTMHTNQGGNYVVNESVMESWERTDNEDGSATYTIKIKEGLVYNNGEAITAKDYVFRLAFVCTPSIGDLGVSSATNEIIVGGVDYSKGEAATLAGVRLIDDYTLSLTVVADYAQYYYADTYASVSPWNMNYWIGEGYDIADDGEGVYFTDAEGNATYLDVAAIADNFHKAKGAEKGEYVSAGPYNLTKWDAASKQVTLTINPNYAGNFEGQKPSIETIIVTKAEEATWADAMKTGALDIYQGITDGEDINTIMDMIDNGAEFQTVEFDRAGYGKVVFFCDVTPTQFKEVRQAVAHLLDRVQFADTFCIGWGGVVDGPYCPAHWQYQESKDFLADNLNTYAYDVDKAIAVLEEGGWTLNAEGGAYTDGIRYKEVTEEQAKYYDLCVTLADGRILMPLKLRWLSSEGNPVSELLASMLANGDQVKQAGMEIIQDIVDWNTLLGNLYREDMQTGEKLDPYYSMSNLATSWSSAIYDYSFNWTDDEALLAMGYNQSRLFDMEEGGLDQLSMDMVYSEEVIGNQDAYLDLWQKYIDRWNEMLPELPLYSNIYCTAVPTWVEGYVENSFWQFQSAILYASIPTAE